MAENFIFTMQDLRKVVEKAVAASLVRAGSGRDFWYT